jgi:CxxC motif-containing protein (DUF1111 family)
MNSGPRRCGVSGSASILHDGRTKDLVVAIRAHRSAGNRFGPSEANKVIDHFDNIGSSSQQDLLNFLRSL